MAPRSKNVRRWRHASQHRFEEAEILLRHNRNTGAVYVGGYSVECILKALILSVVSASREHEVLRSFSGSGAHNLDSLRSRYQKESGQSIGREIVEHLTRVGTWSTDLRYDPRLIPSRDAEDFLSSAKAVLDWADGRL